LLRDNAKRHPQAAPIRQAYLRLRAQLLVERYGVSTSDTTG
jgi:hypothetical protein